MHPTSPAPPPTPAPHPALSLLPSLRQADTTMDLERMLASHNQRGAAPEGREEAAEADSVSLSPTS
jgi:hypothetical protein